MSNLSRLWCLLTVAFLSLLVAGNCMAQNTTDTVQISLLAVAQTGHPRAVDGVLKDAAWENAVGFIALIPIGAGDISQHETTVPVTYIDERLYVAYACHFDPSIELQDGA